MLIYFNVITLLTDNDYNVLKTNLVHYAVVVIDYIVVAIN